VTKKNLKPQQAAPVQREINTTASDGTGLMTPQGYIKKNEPVESFWGGRRRVITSILTLTSKSVKSLFLLARAHGLHQRIDSQSLLIRGFRIPGTGFKQDET